MPTSVLPLLLGLVVTAGESTREGGSSPRVEQVVIVFKTHFDIGYTDMAVNVVQRYRTTMIDQALQVCDRNRDLPAEQQFVWTIPGWPLTKILEDWKGQTTQRRQRVLEAFRTGRFVVHALPFTTHTELLEAEDLVRGLQYASQLSRLTGQPLPRDAKMTDVPCHSWILPTLLRHAGVDFLHLGCNSASASPEVPRLFWWEGPDGSRLLTMYTAEGYGTGLIPPADWPSKTWLALTHTGDNHGPPTPDEVKRLLDEARLRLPGVKVRIGRLTDFADAVLAEKTSLPVVRADMPDTWIHGPLCDPAGARIARSIRPTIAATESLNCLLRLWGVPVADARGPIATAYENSLLYGEHTWGGSLAWILQNLATSRFPYGEDWKKDRAGGRFQRLEASWDEHTAYIQKAQDVMAPVQRANLVALSQAVGVEGPRVVVYNPLPWKRSGLVDLAFEVPDRINAVKPAEEETACFPAVRTADGRFRFLAHDVPPMGYKTFLLAQAVFKPPSHRADLRTATMENPFFKVVLDPARGTIRSLIDRRSGRELVDTSLPHGFGQYLDERFDANQVQGFIKSYAKSDHEWVRSEFGKPRMPPASEAPYRAHSPRDFALQFKHTPVEVSAILESASRDGLPAVKTRFVLPAEQSHLDVEITLHNKPADPWPEAGWLCLPIKVAKPRFRLGRLGSIIDPTRDIIAGSNHYIWTLNSGLTITDPQGHGAGLCPLDHPLVSLDVPGCWKYSRVFVPQRSLVYVNLFNNQWTTNFRMWNEGTWTSRVRIWPVENADAEAALVTPSAEARFPLLAGFADGPAGKLPASRGGVAVSRRGVMVTAFGSNPDGPGTLLRLWEQAGTSGACDVQFPAGMTVTKAQRIDLRGRPIGTPIPVRDSRLTVPLQAFAPATYLIEETR
jgi:hypothetical protein